jgi:hypothetical protein
LGGAFDGREGIGEAGRRLASACVEAGQVFGVNAST